MIDSTFKNAAILIVDDNIPNIDILVGLLTVKGFTNLETLTDPRLVADAFKSFNPDLILLDLMMPYLNGYEVMAQLKGLIPSSSYLPILVLTADISAEARQRALFDGAKDFLAKPFDLVEVVLRIENLLFARYLHQQLQNQNQVLEEKVLARTLDLERINVDLVAAKKKTEESERKLHILNADLEHRVAERTSQLKMANKELEAFSYSVSHDLKAPLRHISGFIDLLTDLKTTRRTEEELRYLKVISNGASEMGKLIDALLGFSRLKRQELRKTTISMSSMVSKVLDFFEPETRNRKIVFNIGEIPDCEGDEQLLKQVWINLVSNAVKYTGKKEEAIIEIGSAFSDYEITYFIKDNGAGFNMQHAGKLFGVFNRLHKNGEFEGIGIGLANVNSIIVRHGGHCTAMGEAEKGATFSFSLPFAF